MFECNISYTFLSTYLKCKKRALLQYIRRMVPSEKVNHRPFIVGIVADWLFRKWVEQGYPEGWMEKKAEEMFYWWVARRYILYRNPSDKAGLIRKLIMSVQQLEGASFSEGFPDRRLVLQKKLTHKADVFNFVGKLDIWFPDEKAVWDLKITKSTRYLDNFQLFFFAWLLQQNGFEIESVAFISPLMRPYVRPVEYSLSIKQEFEEKLWGVLEELKTTDWAATAKDCWGCPVSRFCEEPVDVTRCKKLPSGGIEFEL